MQASVYVNTDSLNMMTDILTGRHSYQWTWQVRFQYPISLIIKCHFSLFSCFSFACLCIVVVVVVVLAFSLIFIRTYF